MLVKTFFAIVSNWYGMIQKYGEVPTGIFLLKLRASFQRSLMVVVNVVEDNPERLIRAW